MAGLPANSATLRLQQRGLALLREGNREQWPALKIMVLSSFNADALGPFLQGALEPLSTWGEIRFGSFGQLGQPILNQGSELYQFQPDLVIVIPAVEDVMVPIFQNSAGLTQAQSDEFVSARLHELRGWLDVLQQRLPSAMIFTVPFGTDRLPGSHVLRSDSPARGQLSTEAFVAGVRGFDTLTPRIVTVDWDWHARTAGWASLRDDRLWYLARMRLNFSGLGQLAELIATHVAVVRRPARKVAVLDLDNTLWGGVVGEAGVSGIELGNEGTGLAYQEFQRELLKWHDAGILLAICSKNNPDDALAAIEDHPAGILRREHFAGMRINWQDKAANIRELAQELNLGLDSFVFYDDNPVEREWVATAVPEVLVPELPVDPADRPAFLRAASYFWRVQVTETDLARARSYQAAKIREEFKANTANFDDFLASLQVELEIATLNQGSLARATQMCERTNQFNLTTKRYTASELARSLTDGTFTVFTLNVRDRFEDSGLTGLAILKRDGRRAEIDTLLLSCRVLGRKIEDAFLAFLVASARAEGVAELVGRYLPTKKNQQVANFYTDRGFQRLEDGAFVLRLNGQDSVPANPPHIALKISIEREHAHEPAR